ncbi:MAG TPA: DNA-formamidopyrimidine glycosylase family protein [Microbacterium sp.]|uniref:DNA-formamidopyrimidine glycosylase family protein n=1 Tax=Microbacterium sp. TaxID=51671 RepID=UPI002B4908FC|nr:DNA-formamidopyrimidine glycosylase family protein [Microbacterium sp.]HKT57009.1 DNA-formamidopyrimidine glycosylase family protein [Microbacterium sp.]
MPESPEVQAFAESVAARVVGRGVDAFTVRDFRAYKTRGVDPGVLAGAVVSQVRRLGKYVDVVTDRQHLVVSFGRHGWGAWRETGAETPPSDPPVIATIAFDDRAALDLTDAGSFRSAALWVVADPAEVAAIASLGPDPADAAFSQSDVDAATVGRRKQLKAVLQEQTSFAGIGNAYSDEILFAARLSPTMHAALLSDQQRERLFRAMTDEIGGAIAARRGIPIADQKATKVAAMRVHGRAGESCPACGGQIEDFTFAGTSAQWCPSCQSAG